MMKSTVNKIFYKIFFFQYLCGLGGNLINDYLNLSNTNFRYQRYFIVQNDHLNLYVVLEIHNGCFVVEKQA